MSPAAIVSYDGSEADRAALELGRLLAEIGGRLSLAYVRHRVEPDPDVEARADGDARALLAGGAALLGDPGVAREVVIRPSTADGLSTLAAARGAEVIAFGSDYRTPAGRVAVGPSAARLLQDGPTAVAIAPAGYRARDLDRVGVLPGTADEASIETAFSIAARHDARVTDSPHGVDLLVVGSRREARPGRTMLSSSAANAIQDVTCPVLVVARDAALFFETLVTA